MEEPKNEPVRTKGHHHVVQGKFDINLPYVAKISTGRKIADDLRHQFKLSYVFDHISLPWISDPASIASRAIAEISAVV